jgi:hypothetical protein
MPATGNDTIFFDSFRALLMDFLDFLSGSEQQRMSTVDIYCRRGCSLVS